MNNPSEFQYLSSSWVLGQTLACYLKSFLFLNSSLQTQRVTWFLPLKGHQKPWQEPSTMETWIGENCSTGCIAFFALFHFFLEITFSNTFTSISDVSAVLLSNFWSWESAFLKEKLGSCESNNLVFSRTRTSSLQQKQDTLLSNKRHDSADID